jgi:hypothetical protein
MVDQEFVATLTVIRILSLIQYHAPDNIASWYTCIYFARSNANHEIKCCNIIRNTQVSLNTQGTISLYGKIMIEDSCILENKADYIFYITSSSYTITLSNCTVDKTTTSTGSLIIRNTVTKSFIHALNHMSTQNCNAKYDSVGTLTPIIPPLSSSKRQRLYYSCDRLFNQLPPQIFLFFVSFYFSI